MAAHPGPESLSANWFPIVLVLGVCIKVLLGFGYRSTDFEVHRNWMAVTFSKPVGQWYTERTSEWTLDYPPLFALFELVLAHVAVFFDREMLSLRPSEYVSTACVVFQRGSVIASDFVLVAALVLYASTWPVPGTPSAFKKAESVLSDWKLAAVAILVFLNGGLLLVDSVHFQYNGMLLGMLILALACWRAGWFLSGAVVFTLLLLTKHLFLVLAPMAAVFLTAAYVLPARPKALPFSSSQILFSRKAPAPEGDGKSKYASMATVCLRFVSLGVVVIGLTAAVLGPFLLTTGSHEGATSFESVSGAASQIASRLFPFNRGLTHAYWAPNWWALYRAADIVLVRAAPLLARWSGGRVALTAAVATSAASATRGLVGVGSASPSASSFVLLAVPSPALCAALTLLAMTPALVALWRQPSGRLLPLIAAQCALSAFLFGWHVHEKAVLTALIPMALAAVDSPADMASYSRLLLPAMVSLCPLLFGVEDRALALAVTALQLCVVSALSASENWPNRPVASESTLGWMVERCYWLVCVGTAAVWAVWPLAFADGGRHGNMGEGAVWMPFLPLLLVSVVSAIGIIASWLELTFLVIPRRVAIAASEDQAQDIASVPESAKLKAD
jgi:alpha-1,3-glucosyltransferase